MSEAKLVWVVIMILAAIVCTRADDLPSKLNFDHYKPMLMHSPFAVATAGVAPAEAPNFAKDLYLANAARSANGAMVTIASSSDKDFKRYLITGASVDGYSIARIEWSHKVGETKVTISKDGQQATLRFNRMISAQPLPNRPAVLPQQSAFQRPIALPTATPHIRGPIQGNSQGRPPPPSTDK
jgi:hypothetical protein